MPRWNSPCAAFCKRFGRKQPTGFLLFMNGTSIDPATAAPPRFTPYQRFAVAMLAFLQFTIVLDFMVLSPLGAILLPALKITPQKFGLVVSAYAIAAAVSGVLAAGFADRYDRKRF